MTKLDVLMALMEVKICTRLQNAKWVKSLSYAPLAAKDWEGVDPIYETLPG